jgi:hypothetical protein
VPPILSHLALLFSGCKTLAKHNHASAPAQLSTALEERQQQQQQQQ